MALLGAVLNLNPSPAATSSEEENRPPETPLYAANAAPMPGWARLLFPSVRDLIFIALLMLFGYGALSLRLLGDADTGWHIRDGQQIVTTHSVPRTDSFSSTMSGKPWYAWEWLYDATTGLVYNRTGLNGVVLLSAVLIALTFAVLFRILSRRANLAVAIVFLLLSASASTIHFLARPHIVSWLFTLLWFHVLDSTEGSDSPGSREDRRLYWLPVLMLLWANLHGGFLMGFILLGIFLIAAAVEALSSSAPQGRTRATKRARLLALITFLSLLVSLVNPYGYKLHSHVYAYLSSHFLMSHIEEFQSPNFHQLAPRCFIVLLLLAIFTLSVSSRRARASQVLLVLFATYSGLYAARNIPIASILMAVAIAPLFSAWMGDRADGRQTRSTFQALASRAQAFSQRMGRMESRPYGHLWPAIFVLVSIWICAHQGRLDDLTLMNAEFDAKRFPVRAVDVISAQHVPEPIFSVDSWGGYLIYRLYPQVKVVVDDRHDLYGEQFLKKYLKVIHVEPDWQQILDQWNVKWVLLPANSALSSTLKETSHWKIISDDGVGILFERRQLY